MPADTMVAAYYPWRTIYWPDFTGRRAGPYKHDELSDAIAQFYPWKVFWADSVKNGEIPLWNPLIISGVPFLATLHSQALYPLNALFLLLPSIDAWNLFVASQLFLSVLFTFLFLRELKLSSWPALFGGLAFALSGYMMPWLEYGTGGHTGLWLPLILLAVEKLSKGGGFGWIAAGSVAWALSVFAGDFQSSFYSLLLVLAFLVFRRREVFKKGLLIFVLGTLIAAPQVLPTVELYSSSIREGDNYRDINFGIVPWSKLILFFAPDLYGNPATLNWRGGEYYYQSLAYVGVATLILAFFAILFSKKKDAPFFSLALLISLLFIFPTPFASLPYKLKIPVLASTAANRLFFLPSFVLPVLAAFGMEGLRRKTRRRFAFPVLIFLVGLIFASFVGAKFYFGGKSLDQLVSLRNSILPLGLLFTSSFLIALSFLKRELVKLVLPLLFFLLVFDLFRFGHKYLPFSEREFVFPESKITNFLKEQEKPFRVVGDINNNWLMPYGIETIEGYDSIYPKQYSQLMALLGGPNLTGGPGRYVHQQNFERELFNLMNVKYIIRTSDRVINNDQVKPVFKEEGMIIYENLKVYPRAFLVNDYKIADEKEVVTLLGNQEVNFADSVVLAEDPKVDLVAGETGREGEVEVVTTTANKVLLTVDSPTEALLFVSQNYYPGWKAFVDGKRQKIIKANFSFGAIPVSQGRHKVELVYDPYSFKIGVLISALTLLLLAFMVFKNDKVKTFSFLK